MAWVIPRHFFCPKNRDYEIAHPMQALTHSLNSIDSFIEELLHEEGLSRNTLEAYRNDLTLFSKWLSTKKICLNDATDIELRAYFVHRFEDSKATTSNRRLAVFRRYFRWALRENHITQDPTIMLLSAKQPLRVPNTLTEAQVDALLEAPDTSNALGIRDRTMLELMYASGLRVSELVTLSFYNISLKERKLCVIPFLSH